MIREKIYQKSFMMGVILAVVFGLAALWPSASAAAGPSECTLIGTWNGNAGSPLKWLGIHTAGSSPTKGEMLLEWLQVRNDLLVLDDNYPSVKLLTQGHGVWEQTSRGKYKYTWYAYGKESLTDPPSYSVRVSGIASITNCNYAAIVFTYEIFDGFVLPQDMSAATPIGYIADYAEQTRVPLTVVTPPE
jgi:hypothetical protein